MEIVTSTGKKIDPFKPIQIFSDKVEYRVGALVAGPSGLEEIARKVPGWVEMDEATFRAECERRNVWLYQIVEVKKWSLLWLTEHSVVVRPLRGGKTIEIDVSEPTFDFMSTMRPDDRLLHWAMLTFA